MLAGYSFGAASAWRAAQHETADLAGLAALWLVAPPVGMMGQPATAPSLPVTIFHPEADDFTTPEALQSWAATVPDEQPQVRWIAGANHFFHGTQEALASAIGQAAEAFPKS